VLVAHVSCGAGAVPSTQECERFLRDKLPAYMVPVAWHFLPRLPVTANGKVDRKALMQAHVQAGPATAVRRRYEPPANDVEHQLCSLWQRILKVSEVGVADDFFELGGQSFDAVRLFAAIKKTFGRAFSLADIWSARTVRELAKRMEPANEDRAGCRVVAINDGRSGTPLFLVHPAGGSVLGYAALGRKLQRPLYGLEVNSGSQLAAVRQDIAKLAKEHLTQIRSVQPRGPYRLGGWSTGAMIAFEMAAQLEAAGESVERVFLLDGPTPESGPPPGDEELLGWFIQDLGLDLPVERLLHASADEADIEARLRKALRIAKLDEAVDLFPSYTIFADLVGAGRRYSPGKIGAPLTVVRVEEDVVAEFAQHPHLHAPDWGWQQHATGEVRCLRVAGTHYTFLNDSRNPWTELSSHS
jgi:thioesterase domain-containing protein/acyl carrier protein